MTAYLEEAAKLVRGLVLDRLKSFPSQPSASSWRKVGQSLGLWCGWSSGKRTTAPAPGRPLARMRLQLVDPGQLHHVGLRTGLQEVKVGE